MSGETSLINLGNLSKPADTLIKKVSGAVGVLFEPRQIRRVAKAKADAAVIQAKNEIEITDLHRRAASRWIDEEAKKQENMESITAKAVPLLESTSNPEEIEDDWIVNFFDKCRITSDEQMQSLWSKILAGEANAPGTFSKRTITVVGDLDKSDAVLFTQLCGYIWMIHDKFVPVVISMYANIYKKNNINYDTLNHLQSVGLINVNYGFVRDLAVPQQFRVSYYGKSVDLKMDTATNDQIAVGHVMLTKAGEELMPICGGTVVDGFEEYVLEDLREQVAGRRRR